METVSDDGETVVRRINRYGLRWTVITDPAESRWWLGDSVSVQRGYTGWNVSLAGREVSHHRRHRQACEAAVDAYLADGR